MRYFHLTFIVFIYLLSSCVNNTEPEATIITTEQTSDIIINDSCEIDNSLKSIKIGNQVWMSHNLNVDTFRNGEIILHASTKLEWDKAGTDGTPAWCYYLNSTCMGKTVGKLYNFHAIDDSRGLAPEGWHIPTDEEWNILEKNIGNSPSHKLKSKELWFEGGVGIDEYGFNAQPGGLRYYDGDFLYYGESGFWWTSSSVAITHAWFRYISFDYFDKIFRQKTKRYAGMSVRCIKDY